MITQEDVLNRKFRRVAVEENVVLVVLLGGWSEGNGEHMLSVIYVPTNQCSAAKQCHTRQPYNGIAARTRCLWLQYLGHCSLHPPFVRNHDNCTRQSEGMKYCLPELLFVECLSNVRVSASARKVIAARGESDAGIL